MNILLFSAISIVLMSSSAASGPSDIDMNVAPITAAEPVEVDAVDVPSADGDAAAVRAAADDAEFERLMAAAPDEGDFGESVIIDKTGAEIRVSGFGFSDK